MHSNSKNNEEIIKIIPLGGCREIGKNCTIFEYKEDIIIVDYGVMFPEADMHGVDLIIPDMSYLVKNKEKIKGIVLTHGHEDHIGGLAYLIREINIAIYATKFTLALVKNRLIEHNLTNKAKLIQVEYKSDFSLGSFNIRLIKTTHSIAESAAVLIKSHIGNILHTGDFKIDHTPIDNKAFDFYSFAELGEKGLLALLSDSTNVTKSGFTLSEKDIYHSLRETFKKTKGRIFFATFASNIHRIQILFDLAKEFNKKIVITGRSMESNIKIARKINYLKCTKEQFLSISELKDFPRNRTILITTGTQGEPMSALSLLANEKHRSIMIEEGDTVIISASVIPGNEKGVSKIINNLMRCGANVIYESIEDIHVSGHGHKEELKMMLSLTKPKFFIPIHGEYLNLKMHANLAYSMGVNINNIQVMENGDIIELSQNSICKNGYINLQQIFIDSKSRNDIGSRIMNDRKVLSQEGIVFVMVFVKNLNKKVVYEFEFHSKGFIEFRNTKILFQKAKDIASKSLDKIEYDYDKIKIIKNKVESAIKSFFYHKTKRHPIIITNVINK